MDWAPWAYQYGVGLFVVLLGIWAGFKNDIWSWQRPRWLAVIVGGWLAMLTLQGVFQYLGGG